MWQFVKGIFLRIWRIILDLLDNLETVVILLLASMGTSAIISDLPFLIYIPVAIEAFISAPMIVPVLGVMLVSALVMSIRWRLSNAI